MIKKNLVKVSSQIHKDWRTEGTVEFIVERYANPKKPTHIKLWVVNGEHQFTRQTDCSKFTIELCKEIRSAVVLKNGGLVKTYSDEVYRAAILG